MVERESWRIIEIKIRRYPEMKRKYEEYIAEIMSSQKSDGYKGKYTEELIKTQSVTELKAMKMTSAYMDRIKKEIMAVEYVYNNLKPEEQKVMRERFWKDKKKNTPYEQMTDCNYSERQMQRIVRRIIVQVGKHIGELK